MAGKERKEKKESKKRTPKVKEPAPQPLSYSECLNFLLELREKMLARLNQLETLQRKLAVARCNSKHWVYCWEDKEGYTMVTVAKPTPGFLGIQEKFINPLPEGATKVDISLYEEQLDDAVSHFRRELEEADEKLESLEEIPGGKGISCFRLGNKVEIKLHERGPFGFCGLKK